MHAGGEIASTFEGMETVRVGHAKLIEEIMVGEDRLIHFSGVGLGQACTIVLRGASAPFAFVCCMTIRLHYHRPSSSPEC